MKQILLTIVVVFSSLFLFSQKKSIEVFTTEKGASFIPFVNGKQMTVNPVDTFYFECDTFQYVQLFIQFPDVHVANIYRMVKFDSFKNKKYQISKAKEEKVSNDFSALNKNKETPMYERYEIIDLSMKKYLHDLQE